MIDHSGIQVSDIAKARAFYEAALKPLGAQQIMEVPKEHADGKVVVAYGRTSPDFWLTEGEKIGATPALCLCSRQCGDG